jgi:hypothetical protein
MRSLDRILLTLERKVPDRVPVITFSNISDDNLGPQLKNLILEKADAEFEIYEDAFSYMSFPGLGTMPDLQEIRHPDGWIERKYRISGRQFSEVFTFSNEGLYRIYKKHVIDDIGVVDDLVSLDFVPPGQNADFKERVASYPKLVESHTGSNEFCMMIVNDPLSFLCANSSPEDVSIWTITDRPAIRAFLDETLKRALLYLEYMLERADLPAVFLMGGAEFAIPPLMSPRDFDEFVLAYDKEMIRLIHKFNKKVIVHCHGKIGNFISSFIEMGADGVHPLEPVGSTGDCEIRKIKEKYGRDICLVGNIQYEDFAEITPQEMDRNVRLLMETAKDGGGFILSPGCPFYSTPMPASIEANIRAYIEAGNRYGRY